MHVHGTLDMTGRLWADTDCHAVMPPAAIVEPGRLARTLRGNCS